MTLLPIASLFATLLFGADDSDFVVIPGGDFVMGDHAGLGGGDAKHPSDEVPLHAVSIDSFRMERFEVTNARFAEFLQDGIRSGRIVVQDGFVKTSPTGDTLYQTRASVAWSRIALVDGIATVLDGRERHPVSGVRWKGAAAYCNWLSETLGTSPVYDLAAGSTDFSADGFRLPTEAEWEYAALGGKRDPYPVFPWGNDSNASGRFANWQNSGDPYESGEYPWTTPVGFYDGTTHRVEDFRWPGSATEYATRDGSNGYGLHDVSGNVWEWVNDWYQNPYYQTSPSDNPTGPTEAQASAMPDGGKYRAMRGGNWYNGAEYFGHGRIANRNPSYFRGPQDPNHPYYHIGFRVATRNLRRATAVGTATRPGRGHDLRMTGSVSTLRAPAGSPVRLEIRDLAGRILFASATVAGEGGIARIRLPPDLPGGLLLATATSARGSTATTFPHLPSRE